MIVLLVRRRRFLTKAFPSLDKVTRCELSSELSGALSGGRAVLGLGILPPFKRLHHFFLVHKLVVGKGEVQRRPTYECRCDERLKTKDEESTHLVYTGFLGGLELLKIETRFIDERFPSVIGECVIVKV